jgi:hypothetical protein
LFLLAPPCSCCCSTEVEKEVDNKVEASLSLSVEAVLLFTIDNSLRNIFTLSLALFLSRRHSLPIVTKAWARTTEGVILEQLADEVVKEVVKVVVSTEVEKEVEVSRKECDKLCLTVEGLVPAPAHPAIEEFTIIDPLAIEEMSGRLVSISSCVSVISTGGMHSLNDLEISDTIYAGSSPSPLPLTLPLSLHLPPLLLVPLVLLLVLLILRVLKLAG